MGKICTVCYKEKTKSAFYKGSVCKKCTHKAEKKAKRNKEYKRKNGYLNLKKASDKNSIVYLIKMWKGKEEFLKVGFTTKTLAQRFSTSPYRYKTIHTQEVHGKWAFEYEQAIHAIAKKFKYYPAIKFGGYTECYTMDAEKRIATLFRY